MKAVHIKEPGGPEVLVLEERPDPVPQHGEVLIKMEAAGINRPDVAQRKGHYPAPKGAPADIPGLEVAGTIVKLGKAVDGWKIGDRVCALVSGGGYAELVAAPASQCLPIPKGLSMQEAASLPETFFTIWNNVFDIGKFQEGETVLIHGGSSGIGVAGIQMVRAMGGNVLVTAGNKGKCDFCGEIGANLAINYNTRDFEKECLDYTDGKGVDIILDMVGGDYTPKNIRSLKRNGRLVIINAMKGRNAEVDLIQIMVKGLIVTGSTLRPQSAEYKGKIAQNLLEHIWPLIPHKIKPIVHCTFPLQDACRAHQLMESSKRIGKIVLINELGL